MKKWWLMSAVAVLAGAMVASCEKVSLEDASGNGAEVSGETKRFTFTVKGDFTNPTFTGGESNIGLNNEVSNGAQLAKTRAVNDYMQADGVDMTDLWVVDFVKTSADAEGTGAGSSGTGAGTGAIRQMVHQTKEDADWGSPSMALTLGTHHVLFLASRGAGAQYQDGVVTWTKPLDTFYLDYEVTVAKTSNGNRAVTLDRVATKMALKIEDAIPSGTNIISVTPTIWYTGWNMLTGAPVAAPEGYGATVTIPSSYYGVKNAELGVWSLSTAKEWLTDVTVVSKAGETENARVTITDAPFKANRVTSYTGRLYSTSGNNSVSLNTEWLATFNGSF